MSADEGAGFDRDIGADSASGYDTDLGGSTSGGDARDAQVIGGGQTERTGAPPLEGDPDAAAGPSEGTPDDVAFGSRRTEGLDEDTGAGMSDTTGEPGSTTGGG